MCGETQHLSHYSVKCDVKCKVANETKTEARSDQSYTAVKPPSTQKSPVNLAAT